MDDKKCTRCKTTRPIKEFYWRYDQGGHESTCSFCRAEYAKKYRNKKIYDLNPDKFLQCESSDCGNVWVADRGPFCHCGIKGISGDKYLAKFEWKE